MKIMNVLYKIVQLLNTNTFHVVLCEHKIIEKLKTWENKRDTAVYTSWSFHNPDSCCLGVTDNMNLTPTFQLNYFLCSKEYML